MKILLIGDPHFKVTNALESDQFIEEIYKLVKKIKYDKIIILGDILDTHEKVHIQTLCRAIQFMVGLSDISPTYALIGNHDRVNNDVYLTSEHPFRALEHKKNLKIVDKVFLEDSFLFVPYVPTGKFNEALETIDYKKEELKAIFAHQEFKNSIFKDQGDIPPEGVAIYSGHIHNYTKIDNVTYVGTPYQHSYYDSPEKFVMQLDFEEEGIFEEKIRLDIIKKRVQEITASQLLDYQVDEDWLTKLIIHGDKDVLNNDKVLKHPKISYKINHSKTIKFKEFKEVKFKELLDKNLSLEDNDIKSLYDKLYKKIFTQ